MSHRELRIIGKDELGAGTDGSSFDPDSVQVRISPPKRGLSITVDAMSPIPTGTASVLSSPIGALRRRASSLCPGLVRLEGAFHPTGDDRESAGPVHGEEPEGAVKVPAGVGDFVWLFG